jgi:peptidyl-prolyl cis-trans isomerase C
MNKLSAATLFLSLVPLVGGCNQEQAGNPAPATDAGTATTGAKSDKSQVNDPVVIVNGQPVGKLQFAAMLTEVERKRPGTAASPQMQQAMLNELVTLVVLSQEAEARGLDSNPNVRATLDWQRTRTLSQALIADYLKSHPITEEDLKKAYDETYGSETPREYKARHILVASEDDAKAVIAELDAGADFAALAKERSTGPSGPKGGNLGWFDPDNMVPAFAAALAGMERGSYSREPVKTEFGWHVILLEDTRETNPPAFDGVKDKLLAKLREKAISEYAAELRSKADLKAIHHPTPAPTPVPSPGSLSETESAND